MAGQELGAAVSTRQEGELSMSSLDHISLFVTDYARSKAFYEKALAPLGIQLLMEFGQAAGFGRVPKPDFWIAVGPASFQKPEQLSTITPTHIALAARTRAEVHAFHAAALAAGASDFGGPGLRPEYHERYYGAFVLDFDGHNIEAVSYALE